MLTSATVLQFSPFLYVSMASRRPLALYLTIITSTLFSIVSRLFRLRRVPILYPFLDTLLSLYFRSCGLSPCTIDLDDQTTMHFWITDHRKARKRNLVLVHGSGSTSVWQFAGQVSSLSGSYNLYIPDLLFFGKSYTERMERSDIFQARCVAQGLMKIGVDRFSIYGISYGGYVGYWMADMYPEMVEKLVLVSCGIGCTDEQREEQSKLIGRKPEDILVPETTNDLRFLVRLTIYKYDLLKWLPDFIVWDIMEGMTKDHMKEKRDLVKHLMLKKAAPDIPKLTQETLLIWGDKDMVFPLKFAHQLQRHLGPKSKLEIIKDTGHAVNMESPNALNHLIKSFI